MEQNMREYLEYSLDKFTRKIIEKPAKE